MMLGFYEKIAQWLCKIESDKYVHLLVCLIASFVVARKSIGWGGAEHGTAVMIGCAFSLLLAVVKEIIDLRTKDVADVRDVAAGCIGSIAGSLMVLI